MSDKQGLVILGRFVLMVVGSAAVMFAIAWLGGRL